VNAWELQADDTWKRSEPGDGEQHVTAQALLMRRAAAREAAA
jgi:hypothetical protein